MSNTVHAEPTIFVDQRTGVMSYGYRLYDDYAQHYDNTWESIPDDDFAFLKQIFDSELFIINDMLQYVAEHQIGVYIGSTWYDWREIENVFP